MTTALFEIPTPHMPAFAPKRCTVGPVSYDTARQVLADTHYIGTPGATSIALGMHADGVIAGVITFGTIPRNNAAAVCGDGWAPSVMELTRLALYDWLPANGESWFIARALSWLGKNRPDVKIVLSYADGAVGHVGTIYQATNWIYTGVSTNDYVFQRDTGEILHPRTIGRMRANLPPRTLAAIIREAPLRHLSWPSDSGASSARRPPMAPAAVSEAGDGRMTYLTTRSGLVHLPGCRALRADTECWPWRARNDGPGVARACGTCLPDGLPEGKAS